MQAIIQILWRSFMMISSVCPNRFESFPESASLQPPCILYFLYCKTIWKRLASRVDDSSACVKYTVHEGMAYASVRVFWRLSAHLHLLSDGGSASNKIGTSILARFQASRRSAWNVWLQLPSRHQGNSKFPFPNVSRWTSKTGGTIQIPVRVIRSGSKNPGKTDPVRVLNIPATCHWSLLLILGLAFFQCIHVDLRTRKLCHMMKAQMYCH